MKSKPRKLLNIADTPERRLSREQQQIVDRAYQFWLSNCFDAAEPPEENFLQALLEAVFEQDQPPANPGLFLVPKRPKHPKATRAKSPVTNSENKFPTR